MKRRYDTRKKVKQLAALLEDKASLLIVMQDHPDPDAIASAAALRVFANAVSATQCSIAHGGIVDRAENRAMVKYLDLNLRPIREMEVAQFDAVALVDTQPATGNNSLPANTLPDAVIDHHPRRRAARLCGFTDIRARYGATSTILFEYLHAAGVLIEAPLATALLYGIRSDTQDLGRETTKADIAAFFALYPISNKRMLNRIERGDVPAEYFRMLAVSLRNAQLIGRSIVTSLDDTHSPDMIAEIADLLLRHEGADWSLCLGFYEGRAIFSLRTSEGTASAGDVARQIADKEGTAGGHKTLAAGQISLERDDPAERTRLTQTIRERFLAATGDGSAQVHSLAGD